jgi:acyl dehydratase
MKKIIRNLKDAQALEGKEVGVSDWILIDQDRLNLFADATDDHQWLHVDPERAKKELPTGSTIAHGYLLIALLPALTGGFCEFVGLERIINYGLNKVRFKSMVPVDSRVRVRSVVKSARKRAGSLQLIQENFLEVEGQARPACIAETIAMYYISDI